MNNPLTELKNFLEVLRTMLPIYQKAETEKKPQNIDKFVKYWFSTFSSQKTALFEFFKAKIYWRERTKTQILGVFVEEKQFLDYLDSDKGKKGKSIFGSSLWTEGHVQENQWRRLFKYIAEEKPRIFVGKFS